MIETVIVVIVASICEIEQQLIQDVSTVETTINQHSHDYSLHALLDQPALTTIEIHGSVVVFVLKATKTKETWTAIIKPHLSTQLGPKS